MIATDNILDIIILEFSQFKKRITSLYNESSNFLEVCEDYVLCLESIKKLELTNNLKKEKEISDLKLVMTELKKELFSKI